MAQTEQDFARLYAGLLSWLDPDPVRSKRALRSVRQALSGAGGAPKKKRRGGSNSEGSVI